jgi:hypothetical protein
VELNEQRSKTKKKNVSPCISCDKTPQVISVQHLDETAQPDFTIKEDIEHKSP